MRGYKILIYVFLICVILVSCVYIYRLECYETVQSQELKESIDKQYEAFNNNIDTSSLNVSDDVIANYYKYKEINNDVIGKINIEKLNIEYPIINKTTEDLLKIAPTKYCGPNPNSVGNLVIVGHNYYDGTMFSDINKLVIGDIIHITDISGTKCDYKVYEEKVIDPTDFSCINQETDSKKEVTLITCVNGIENRLILKCVEV